MSTQSYRPIIRIAAAFAGLSLATLCMRPAQAHEAWLLTPSEIEALSRAPMPEVFAKTIYLGPAALVALAVVLVALTVEDRLRPWEGRIAPPLSALAASVGPLVLRLGLAAMLALAGTGGLPRHGVAPWTEATLLVPDMQLALIPGWEGLAVVQIALALVLLVGIGTRIAGGALVALSALGLGLFGADFLSYAPHFAGPGLVLIALGGGAASADALLDGGQAPAVGPRASSALWTIARVLMGAGFIYLAVAFKLTQPTLLIAILDHAKFPAFGLPMAIVALVMTGVEIVCGALLVAGRLVRPVALTVIGAISVLAIALGETPLFHANLYGVLFVLAFAGPHAPAPVPGGRRLALRGGLA